ncbi:uncharacterized protein LOC119976528 [Scyliorhinus canicula]|uniref:uncharacterized protein LOC119976528 n=1 Tax=Scyliorhinus canicula TaxID=7830 RepID=UPI0018F28BDE|nr:uncharacterized protein LOC119976528 [Scyliorhinus canicula]
MAAPVDEYINIGTETCDENISNELFDRELESTTKRSSSKEMKKLVQALRNAESTIHVKEKELNIVKQALQKTRNKVKRQAPECGDADLRMKLAQRLNQVKELQSALGDANVQLEAKESELNMLSKVLQWTEGNTTDKETGFRNTLAGSQDTIESLKKENASLRLQLVEKVKQIQALKSGGAETDAASTGPKTLETIKKENMLLRLEMVKILKEYADVQKKVNAANLIPTIAAPGSAGANDIDALRKENTLLRQQIASLLSDLKVQLRGQN